MTSKKPMARGCRHFNGIMNDQCRANITYEALQFPLPCLPFGGERYMQCAHFALYTELEIKEQEDRAADALRTFLDALENGRCPECGAVVAEKKQIGRCVYGYPCGHRLYQGKLDPNMSDEEYEAQAFAMLDDDTESE